MDEGLEDLMTPVPAHDEAAEAGQPADGAFYFPALPVAPKGSTVLEVGSGSATSVGGDPLDGVVCQTPAHCPTRLCVL